MRALRFHTLLLAGLALVPEGASAQCACTCMRGRMVPLCQGQALVEPICQGICPATIEQSIAPPSLSPGGTSLGGGGAAAAAGAGGLPAGADAASLRALLGR